MSLCCDSIHYSLQIFLKFPPSAPPTSPVIFVCFLFSSDLFSGVFSMSCGTEPNLSGVWGMFSFWVSDDGSFVRGLGCSLSWQLRYSTGTRTPDTPSHWKSPPSSGFSETKSKLQRRDASSRSFLRASWYSTWSCSRSTGPNRFRLAGPFPRARRIRLCAAMTWSCKDKRDGYQCLQTLNNASILQLNPCVGVLLHTLSCLTHLLLCAVMSECLCCSASSF